ncbi:MAG: carbohydrate ABC transporter permease [Caldilinea sp. CFX5]|nr:carbohydrate ABC transporter permease [Caldilinea sp. CFX5]
MSRYRWQRRANTLLLYLLALLIAGVILFPLLTLLRISLFARIDLYAKPMQWLPTIVKWQNYVDVLAPDHIVPIREAMLNSFLVATATALLTVFLAALASYAFARLRFPGKRFLSSAFLSIYLLPAILFLIPLFVIMRPLRLLDTYLALIIPYTVWCLPLTILVLRDFFDSVPGEIEEAALIDGCSRLQSIRYIMLPLAMPGLVAAWVSTFILAWNEFFTPLILTSRLKVLPTALGLYTSTFDIELGHMAVAGIYSVLPVLLLTFIFQRRIEQGITGGAVKG